MIIVPHLDKSEVIGKLYPENLKYLLLSFLFILVVFIIDCSSVEPFLILFLGLFLLVKIKYEKFNLLYSTNKLLFGG